MISAVANSWALLFGIYLLMLGNGLQGTLLGVRGDIEGFDPSIMGFVMAGYFVGFLGGSRAAPWLIARVGHVRVFAALASFISAIFILYAAVPDPVAWAVMRVAVGFCLSGVYVVAESWMNAAADNQSRGKLLSIYLIVQMAGIISGQFMLNLADPGGYVLFVVISVLVSVSFAPILLSVTPAPIFQAAKGMTLRELFDASPLGFVGIILLGGVFSASFGMSPVFATEVGMTTQQLSIFVAAIFFGGLVLQYPIGWMSDRMDRRILIAGVTLIGCGASLAGVIAGSNILVLTSVAFLIGGASNPLYSLLIAYTNDYLEPEQMAAASGGLVFLGGVGAMGGPVFVGYLMSSAGPFAFFVFIGVLFAAISLYAFYRMTRRSSTDVADTQSYAPVTPSASPVAHTIAQDVAIEELGTEDTI